MPRRPAVDRALLGLGTLVLASTVARFLLSDGVEAPWIAPDEQLYGLLGRALVSGEGLSLFGEPVPYYSLLYPLLVGIPLTLGDLADGVRALQLVQAFAMSLTAVPVYLWTRPLAGGRWALLAAALTLLVPGLVYSGLLMSEALYYPVAVVAVWALARCLELPTLPRQGIFLAALVAALATRLQAVGIVGTLLVAVGLLAFAERSTDRVRRMAPTFAALAAIGVAWTATRIALGGVGELLGAYAPLAQAEEYSVADVAQSVAWQAGAVALLTVGVPLLALGILTWQTLHGREDDPRARALVITAFAYVLVTVVLVGAFASRFVEHVTERQLLSVIAPVFAVFAVWMARGAPRPQPVASVVALVVAASALLLPLERVTTLAAYADAPSMIPLEQLSRHLSASAFETLYAVSLALVLLAAVVLPRRALPLVAGTAAVALGAASVTASIQIRDRSQVERDRTFAGAPVSWIDDTGEQNVVLLLTGDRLWPSTWETLFWNDAVTGIVRLRGVDSPGVVPQQVAIVRRDGTLVTPSLAEVQAPTVAAPTAVSLIGEPMAELPASFEQQGMALWRVDGPVRFNRRVFGVRPNGDLHGGEAALVEVYSCGPGRLELTLLGKQGAPTRIVRDGQVVAERTIPPEEIWRPIVPAPPSADGSGTCRYRIETDGLIGSTRIDFVREA